MNISKYDEHVFFILSRNTSWIRSMERCISGERLRINKIEILIEVVSGAIQNINHLQIVAAPI